MRLKLSVSCFVMAAALAASAGQPTLEELFAYPRIYGTAPRAMGFSPDSQRLAFLWNSGGERFRDIYVLDPGESQPRRLTDMRGEDSDPYDGGVSSFVWSPESTRIAFTMEGDLFLVEASGDGEPAALITSSTPETDVAFSPDSGLLSFVRAGNIWTMDLVGGAVRQLTHLSEHERLPSYPDSSAIQGTHWAPDGSAIALMVWRVDDLEDIVIPDYLPERVEATEWKRSYTGAAVFDTAVGVVEREGGTISWVDFGGDRYFNNSETSYNQSLSWSPDSRTLLINWNGADYRERRLYLADGESLALTEVYRERQEPFLAYLDALWSADGSEILITSEKNGFRHVFALPRDGGQLRQLTSGPWDVLDIEVPPSGDRIFFEASEKHPLERHGYAVPLVGGEITRLTSTPGTHLLTASDDGNRVVSSFSQHQTPPELMVLDVRDPGREAKITSSPLPAFAEVRRHIPEYFSFVKPEDHATLHGFLIKPNDFDPGKRYPAVLSCVYADIAKNQWISYDLLDHFMAEVMGYIVVRLDFRASEGYGRDFRYGYFQKMGIIDSSEAVAAASYLRSLPFVDGERIGLWGSSYGGFLTLMTLFKHPGVFHTGVAWKAVTDWRSYTDDYTAQRLGRPQEYPDVYDATSPIHHVDGLEDHLLIVHGMLDDNVLFQDAVRLVQSLLEAGKDFDVMFYPRADHSLTTWQETFVDLMRRTARYFEDHMGVGPRRPVVEAASSQRPSAPRESTTVVAYACAGLGPVVAEHRHDRGEVFLFLPGETATLEQQPSASGARFSDGILSFWTKDEGAVIERGSKVVSCERDPRRTLMESAKLAGADFWATGNEPGWTMELYRDRVVLTTDYGLSRIEAPLGEPLVDDDQRTTVFRTTEQQRRLVISLRGDQCTDDMSGEIFETTVEVDIDGVLHRGCGQALH